MKRLHDWDWSGAETDFQRAIALNPNIASSHFRYTFLLSSQGRHEEAIAECRRAVEVDPLWTTINHWLGATFYFARFYDQATEQERKALEMNPDNLPARFILGATYVAQSMTAQGIAEFERALAVAPEWPFGLGGLGYAYAVAGRRADALRITDQLNQLSKRRYVPPTALAFIYAGLREVDNAFEWLEEAYGARSLNYLKAFSVWDSIRSDPRFADC